eukprot:GDKJ01010234.1.p1 GENE.GDKJ01010234.1~~GDKJ01010234.1.p1  ORF type:complete len:953 (-),score=210.41 GDKJ01010234.1:659-3517(-)
MSDPSSSSFTSKVLGGFDHIALGVVSGSRKVFGGGFYSDGWGDNQKVEEMFDYVKQCIISGSLPDITVTIQKEKYSLRSERYVGRFDSPLAKFLPDEAKVVDFLIEPPVREIGEVSTFDEILKFSAMRGLCLHCSGTADEYYIIRQILFAKPMWSANKIASFILTLPFYGRRRMPNQFLFVMRSVEWYRMQYVCAIFETACLLAHTRKRLCSLNRVGLPILTSGMSMGGCFSFTAAAIATADSQVRGPIGSVPCLGPVNPFPLADQILFHIGNYQALAEDEKQCPLNDDEAQNIIRKIEDVRRRPKVKKVEKKRSFWSFLGYKNEEEQNEKMHESTQEKDEECELIHDFGVFSEAVVSDFNSLAPVQKACLRLKCIFKKDSIDERFLQHRNKNATEKVRALIFVNARNDSFVKTEWSKHLSAMGEKFATGLVDFKPSLLLRGLFEGKAAEGRSLLEERFVRGGHLSNYFVIGREEIVEASRKVAEFAHVSFVNETLTILHEGLMAQKARKRSIRDNFLMGKRNRSGAASLSFLSTDDESVASQELSSEKRQQSSFSSFDSTEFKNFAHTMDEERENSCCGARNIPVLNALNSVISTSSNASDCQTNEASSRLHSLSMKTKSLNTLIDDFPTIQKTSRRRNSFEGAADLLIKKSDCDNADDVSTAVPSFRLDKTTAGFSSVSGQRRPSLSTLLGDDLHFASPRSFLFPHEHLDENDFESEEDENFNNNNKHEETEDCVSTSASPRNNVKGTRNHNTFGNEAAATATTNTRLRDGSVHDGSALKKIGGSFPYIMKARRHQSSNIHNNTAMLTHMNNPPRLPHRRDTSRNRTSALQRRRFSSFLSPPPEDSFSAPLASPELSTDHEEAGTDALKRTDISVSGLLTEEAVGLHLLTSSSLSDSKVCFSNVSSSSSAADRSSSADRISQQHRGRVSAALSTENAGNIRSAARRVEDA